MAKLVFRLLLLGLLLAPVWAKDVDFRVTIPEKKGVFPPGWTDSIRVNVREFDGVVFDHRHFKKGKPFVVVLTGRWVKGEEYTIEVLCQGKGERPLQVWSQKIKYGSATGTEKELQLKSLKLEKEIK